MSDGMRMVVTVAAIALGLLLVVLLAVAPGRTAKARGHANADAIMACGLLGIIFWPLWIAAVIWAYTGPDNGAASAQKKSAGITPTKQRPKPPKGWVGSTSLNYDPEKL